MEKALTEVLLSLYHPNSPADTSFRRKEQSLLSRCLLNGQVMYGDRIMQEKRAASTDITSLGTNLPHCLLWRCCAWRMRWGELQYCGGFRHTLTRIGQACTRVPPSQSPLPPPSASHPSGLSQCTGLECPASCIKPGLVIYFTHGNIHASVLFSKARMG